MTSEQFAAEYTAGYVQVRRYLKGKGFAEPDDLAQRAWLRAWEKRKQYCGKGHFCAWVTRIAINFGRSDFRARKPVDPMPPFYDAAYVDGFEARLQRARAIDWMREMDPDAVAALLRHYNRDEPGPAKSTAYHFRTRLREQVRQREAMYGRL